MGGKSPKIPAFEPPPVQQAAPPPEPEPVTPMPDPDDLGIKTEQKRKAARRIASSGRSSTILSDGLGGR